MTSGFLRLYLRRTLRGRRLAASLAVTAIPVALVIAALAGLTATRDTPQQRIERLTYGSDVTINLPLGAELADTTAQIAKLRDLWGPSYRVEPSILIPEISVNGPGGAFAARLVEAPADIWARLSLYRLTSGQFPTQPGQLAVSEPVAQRLGLTVGAPLALNLDQTAPMRLSGIFVSTTKHNELFVIAGPGTVATLSSSQVAANSLVITHAAHINRLDGGAVDPMLREFSAAFGNVSDATKVVEPEPFWIRNASLVAVPTLLLIGALMLARIAVRSRRTRNELTFLWTLGLGAAQIRRLILVEVAVLGVGGALLAAVGGVAAALLARTVVAGMAGRDIQPTLVGVNEVLVVLAVPLLLAAVGGWIRLYLINRDIQQIGSIADDFEATSTPVVRRWRRPTLLAVGAAIVCVILLASGPLQAMLTVSGLTIMLALVGGTILHRFWCLVRARVRSGWLPAGLERGSSARSLAILIVTLTAVAIPCGLMATNDTYTAAARTQYRAEYPIGQVHIHLRGRELPPAAFSALTAAAKEKPLVVSRVGNFTTPQTDRWSAVPVDTADKSEMSILVIADPMQATAPWGLPNDPALAQWLETGGALLLNADRPAATTEFAITHIADNAAPAVIGNLTARIVPTDRPLRRSADLVITTETAKRMGLPIATLSWRFLNGGAHIEAIREAAIAHGIAPDLVRFDPGPPNAIRLSYRVTVLASVALVLLSAFLISHAGLSELARTRRQLKHLGAPHRTVGIALCQLSAAPALLGAICGLGIGVVGGWLSTLARSIPFTVEVLPLLALAAAAVAAALLGSLKTVVAQDPT